MRETGTMAITVGRSALATVNLVLAQGADNAFSFRYTHKEGSVTTPVDLSQYTGEAQVRDGIGGTVYLEITPVLNSDGTIEIMITAAETEVLSLNTKFVGRWDMELTAPGGEKVRFAEGRVTIWPDVTRDV